MSSGVAQRLDWRVSRGLNLLRDSDLFFVPHSWHDEYVIFLHFFCFLFQLLRTKLLRSMFHFRVRLFGTLYGRPHIYICSLRSWRDSCTRGTFLAVGFKLTCTHSSRSSAAKTIQHFDALIPPATQANTYMTYHFCVCI